MRSVSCFGTWVDLSVGSDAVSIHDVLESRGELVGLVESRWSLFGLHSVQDGRNCGTTPFLQKKKNDNINIEVFGERDFRQIQHVPGSTFFLTNQN